MITSCNVTLWPSSLGRERVYLVYTSISYSIFYIYIPYSIYIPFSIFYIYIFHSLDNLGKSRQELKQEQKQKHRSVRRCFLACLAGFLKQAESPSWEKWCPQWSVSSFIHHQSRSLPYTWLQVWSWQRVPQLRLTQTRPCQLTADY